MHLLVFRFSAMGDVALTVPVIRNVLKHNEDLHITLVTNPNFTSFFYGIDRLTILPADFKKKYPGLKGLYKLFQDIKSETKFDYLIDLHSVLRSWLLSFLLSILGLKVYRINKGRREKRKIIEGKSDKPLIHTTDRYNRVFDNIIRISPFPSGPSIVPSPESITNIESFIRKEEIPTSKKWIGIAPMAKHELKRWNINNIKLLIKLILELADVHFFLFGGGQIEKEILQQVSSECSNSTNITGRLKMGDEIALISKMSFMLTMDSGNMHISSLIGVPTVSIWGATHPKIGFGALNQPEKFSMQVSEAKLNCRPCTIYGKGNCRRGDIACLNWVSPEMVYELLNIELLDSNR